MNNRYKKFPLVTRIISIVLIVTFLAQDIAWSHPDSFIVRSSSDKLAPDTLFHQKGKKETAEGVFIERLIESQKDFISHPSIPTIKSILNREDIIGWIQDNHIFYSDERCANDEIGAVRIRVPGWGLLRYFDPTKVSAQPYSRLATVTAEEIFPGLWRQRILIPDSNGQADPSKAVESVLKPAANMADMKKDLARLDKYYRYAWWTIVSAAALSLGTLVVTLAESNLRAWSPDSLRTALVISSATMLLLYGFICLARKLIRERLYRDNVYGLNIEAIRNSAQLTELTDRLLQLIRIYKNDNTISLYDILSNPKEYTDTFFDPLYRIFLLRLKEDFDDTGEFTDYCEKILRRHGAGELRSKMVEKEDLIVQSFNVIKNGKLTLHASINFYGLLLFYLTANRNNPSEENGYLKHLMAEKFKITKPSEDIVFTGMGISEHTRGDSAVHYSIKGILMESEDKEKQIYRNGIMPQYAETQPEDRKNTPHADKVRRARRIWESQASKIGYGYLKDMLVNSEYTTIVELDKETPLLFSEPDYNIVRFMHVGRNRSVIFFSSRFIEEASEPEIAAALIYGQRFIDSESKSEEETRVIRNDLTRNFFKTRKEGGENSGLINVEDFRKSLEHFMERDTLARYGQMLWLAIDLEKEIDLLLRQGRKSGDKIHFGEALAKSGKLLDIYEGMGVRPWARKAYLSMKLATEGVQLTDKGGFLPYYCYRNLVAASLRYKFWDDFMGTENGGDSKKGELEKYLTGMGFARRMTRPEIDTAREIIERFPLKNTIERAITSHRQAAISRQELKKIDEAEEYANTFLKRYNGFENLELREIDYNYSITSLEKEMMPEDGVYEKRPLAVYSDAKNVSDKIKRQVLSPAKREYLELRGRYDFVSFIWNRIAHLKNPLLKKEIKGLLEALDKFSRAEFNVKEFDAVVLNEPVRIWKPRTWILGFNTLTRSSNAETDRFSAAMQKLLDKSLPQTALLSREVLDRVESDKPLLYEYLFTVAIEPYFNREESRYFRENLFPSNYEMMRSGKFGTYTDMGKLERIFAQIAKDKALEPFRKAAESLKRFFKSEYAGACVLSAVIIGVVAAAVLSGHPYIFIMPALLASVFLGKLFKRRSASKAEKGDEIIYEINMRATGKHFSQITDEDLMRYRDESGANILWFMGVWRTSPYSKEVNDYWRNKNQEPMERAASSYAITDYEIAKDLGGEKEYRDLVRRANKLGIAVMIDVVPNHMAVDSQLFKECPEYFMSLSSNLSEDEAKLWIEGNRTRLKLKPENTPNPVFQAGTCGKEDSTIPEPTSQNVFYYGRDVRYNDGKGLPWIDDVQFNYTQKAMRDYMRSVLFKAAELTNGGGIRLDMVFLTTKNYIRWNWFSHLSEEEFNKIYPGEDFWKVTIKDLKKKYPNIVILGEMYGSHGHSNLAADLGFDYYYEDYFLKCMVNRDVQGIKRFLRDYVSASGKKNFIKYLENHDSEDRIINLLKHSIGEKDSMPASLAAATLLYTLPGSSLVYEGQEKGHSDWIAKANLIRGPPQQDNQQVIDQYKTLGGVIHNKQYHDIFRFGSCKVLDIGNPDTVIAFEREYNGKKAIIIVNYCNNFTGNIKVPVEGREEEINLPPWSTKIYLPSSTPSIFSLENFSITYFIKSFIILAAIAVLLVKLLLSGHFTWSDFCAIISASVVGLPYLANVLSQSNKAAPVKYWWTEKKRRGLLCPLFSMRREGDDGVGDLASLDKFVDYLAHEDYDMAFLLPTNQTSSSEPSPYNSISLFANNAIMNLPLDEMIDKKQREAYIESFVATQSDFIKSYLKLHYIDPGADISPSLIREMAAQGVIVVRDEKILKNKIEAYVKLKLSDAKSSQRVDYQLLYAFKEYVLSREFEKFCSKCSADPKNEEFKQFESYVNNYEFREEIANYALFHTLLDHHKGKYWREWEEQYRDPGNPNNKEDIERFKKEHSKEIEFYKYAQWLYYKRALKTKKHADELNKFLIGDLPIYPSKNSADVWANQELFDLEKNAGAPADQFNDDGQNWGLPAYRWGEKRQEVLNYWKRRITYAAQFYHGVRIDHLLGLCSEWLVEEGKKALEGKFYPALPADMEKAGRETITELASAALASNLLIIGEDLGERPENVRNMLDELSLKLPNLYLYNVIGWRDSGIATRPHMLAVSETHDTEPTFAGRYENFSDRERRRTAEFANAYGVSIGEKESPQFAEDRMYTVMDEADFSCRSIQGKLKVSPRISRINEPGKVHDKNWNWRMPVTFEALLAKKDEVVPGNVEIPAELLQQAELMPADKLWQTCEQKLPEETRSYRESLSRQERGSVLVSVNARLFQSFDDIVKELEALSGMGIKHVYLLGAYRESEVSRKQSQGEQDDNVHNFYYDRDEEGRVISVVRNGSHDTTDFIASAFSIPDNFLLNPKLGGWEGFRRLLQRAKELKIGISLDLVAHSTAIDCKWLKDESLQEGDDYWYVHKDISYEDNEKLFALSAMRNLPDKDNAGAWNSAHVELVELFDRILLANPGYFLHCSTKLNRWILVAHGTESAMRNRGEYWRDMALLDVTNPNVRRALIDTAVQFAREGVEGFRCDCAMNTVKDGGGGFLDMWWHHPNLAGPRDINWYWPRELWDEMIQAVRTINPKALFIAEAYWLFDALERCGFDYISQTHVFNLLNKGRIEQLKEYLMNEYIGEQFKRAYSIISHDDEPSAIKRYGDLPKEVSRILQNQFLAIAAMPGMPIVLIEQIKGYFARATAKWYQLSLVDRPRPQIQELFRKIISIAQDPLLRQGQLFVFNTSHPGLLSFARYDRDNATNKVRSAVVVGNYADWDISSQIPIGEAAGQLGISAVPSQYFAFTDRLTGEVYLRSGRELRDNGLYIMLPANSYHLFMVQELDLPDGRYKSLADMHTRYKGNGLSFQDIFTLMRDNGLKFDFPCTAGNAGKAVALKILADNLPASEIGSVLESANAHTGRISFAEGADTGAEIDALKKQYPDDEKMQRFCRVLEAAKKFFDPTLRGKVIHFTVTDHESSSRQAGNDIYLELGANPIWEIGSLEGRETTSTIMWVVDRAYTSQLPALFQGEGFKEGVQAISVLTDLYNIFDKDVHGLIVAESEGPYPFLSMGKELEYFCMYGERDKAAGILKRRLREDNFIDRLGAIDRAVSFKDEAIEAELSAFVESPENRINRLYLQRIIVPKLAKNGTPACRARIRDFIAGELRKDDNQITARMAIEGAACFPDAELVELLLTKAAPYTKDVTTALLNAAQSSNDMYSYLCKGLENRDFYQQAAIIGALSYLVEYKTVRVSQQKEFLDALNRTFANVKSYLLLFHIRHAASRLKNEELVMSAYRRILGKADMPLIAGHTAEDKFFDGAVTRAIMLMPDIWRSAVIRKSGLTDMPDEAFIKFLDTAKVFADKIKDETVQKSVTNVRVNALLQRYSNLTKRFPDSKEEIYKAEDKFMELLSSGEGYSYLFEAMTILGNNYEASDEITVSKRKRAEFLLKFLPFKAPSWRWSSDDYNALISMRAVRLLYSLGAFREDAARDRAKPEESVTSAIDGFNLNQTIRFSDGRKDVPMARIILDELKQLFFLGLTLTPDLRSAILRMGRGYYGRQYEGEILEFIRETEETQKAESDRKKGVGAAFEGDAAFSVDRTSLSSLIAGQGLKPDASQDEIDRAILEAVNDPKGNDRLLQILGFTATQRQSMAQALIPESSKGRMVLFEKGRNFAQIKYLVRVPGIKEGAIANARDKIRLSIACQDRYKQGFGKFVALAYSVGKNDNEDFIHRKIDDIFLDYSPLLRDKEFLEAMSKYFEHDPAILLSLTHIVWMEIRAGPAEDIVPFIDVLTKLSKVRKGLAMPYIPKYKLEAIKYLGILSGNNSDLVPVNMIVPNLLIALASYPQKDEFYTTAYETLVSIARSSSLNPFFAFARSEDPSLAKLAAQAVAEARPGSSASENILTVKKNPDQAAKPGTGVGLSAASLRDMSSSRVWHSKRVRSQIDIEAVGRNLHEIQRDISYINQQLDPDQEFGETDFVPSLVTQYCAAVRSFNDFILNGPMTAERMEEKYQTFHATLGSSGVIKNAGSYGAEMGDNISDTRRVFKYMFSDKFSAEIEQDPIKAASHVFVRLVNLQPFNDGNKRAASFVLNYILMKSGYGPFILTPDNIVDYRRIVRPAGERNKIKVKDFEVFLRDQVEKNNDSPKDAISAAVPITISLDQPFTFGAANIEQRQYEIEQQQSVIYPVIEVSINDKKYKVGNGYFVIIILANGKRIYWGGQHNLSYSFAFEHYGPSMQNIINNGGVVWRHLDAHGDFGSYMGKKMGSKKDIDWQEEVKFGYSNLTSGDYLGYLATTGVIDRLDTAHSLDALNPATRIPLKHVVIPEKEHDLAELAAMEISGGVADLDIDIIVGLNPGMKDSEARERFEAMKPYIISIAGRSEVSFLTNSSELNRDNAGVPLNIDPKQAALFNGKIIEELSAQAANAKKGAIPQGDTLRQPSAAELTAPSAVENLGTLSKSRSDVSPATLPGGTGLNLEMKTSLITPEEFAQYREMKSFVPTAADVSGQSQSNASQAILLREAPNAKKDAELITKVKTAVRSFDLRRCLSNACMVIYLLRSLGEKASLMGMFSKAEDQPFQYVAHTEKWGIIDVDPYDQEAPEYERTARVTETDYENGAAYLRNNGYLGRADKMMAEGYFAQIDSGTLSKSSSEMKASPITLASVPSAKRGDKKAPGSRREPRQHKDPVESKFPSVEEPPVSLNVPQTYGEINQQKTASAAEPPVKRPTPQVMIEPVHIYRDLAEFGGTWDDVASSFLSGSKKSMPASMLADSEKFRYRGMRLTVEDLNKIFHDGLLISDLTTDKNYYNFEQDPKKTAFWAFGMYKYGQPQENFVIVVLQCEKSKIPGYDDSDTTREDVPPEAISRIFVYNKLSGNFEDKTPSSAAANTVPEKAAILQGDTLSGAGKAESPAVQPPIAAKTAGMCISRELELNTQHHLFPYQLLESVVKKIMEFPGVLFKLEIKEGKKYRELPIISMLLLAEGDRLSAGTIVRLTVSASDHSDGRLCMDDIELFYDIANEILTSRDSVSRNKEAFDYRDQINQRLKEHFEEIRTRTLPVAESPAQAASPTSKTGPGLPAESSQLAPEWMPLMVTPVSDRSESDYPDFSAPDFVEMENEMLIKRADIHLDEFTRSKEVAVFGFSYEEFTKIVKLCPNASVYHLFNYSPFCVKISASEIWEHFPELRGRVKIYNVDAAEAGQYLQQGSVQLLMANGVMSSEFAGEEKDTTIFKVIQKITASTGLAVIRFFPDINSKEAPRIEKMIHACGTLICAMRDTGCPIYIFRNSKESPVAEPTTGTTGLILPKTFVNALGCFGLDPKLSYKELSYFQKFLIGWYAAFVERYDLSKMFSLVQFLKEHENIRWYHWMSRSMGIGAVWIAMTYSLIITMQLLASNFGIPPELGLLLAYSLRIHQIANIVTHGLYNTFILWAPLTMSKWDQLDEFRRDLKSVDNGVIGKLRKSTGNLGECRRTLMDLGIAFSSEVDGKFLIEEIKSLLETRVSTEVSQPVSNILRQWYEGKHLVSFIGVDPSFKYIVKTYPDQARRKIVIDKWLEEGWLVAQGKLNGLAVPTLVIAATKPGENEFKFFVEGIGTKKTDVAIIQKKVIPLKDIIMENIKTGRIDEAKGLIDRYKQLFIDIFRRGAVDVDYGDPLGNYGVDPETGHIYIFDFGELSSGVDTAYEFTDGIAYVNAYIEDTLRKEVSAAVADYYNGNPFTEKDFYNEKGTFLFGIDYNREKSDSYKVSFPYDEEEARELFYQYHDGGGDGGGRVRFTDESESGAPYRAKFYKTPINKLNGAISRKGYRDGPESATPAAAEQGEKLNPDVVPPSLGGMANIPYHIQEMLSTGPKQRREVVAAFKGNIQPAQVETEIEKLMTAGDVVEEAGVLRLAQAVAKPQAKVYAQILELIKERSCLEKTGLTNSEIEELEHIARSLIVEDRIRVVGYGGFLMKVENNVLWIDEEALSELDDLELKAWLLHELVHLLPDQRRRMDDAYDWYEKMFYQLKIATREYEERIKAAYSLDDRGKEYRRALRHLMYSKIKSEAKAYMVEILYLQSSIGNLSEYWKDRGMHTRKMDLKETYSFLLELLDSEGRIDEKKLHVKQVRLLRDYGDLSIFANFLFFEIKGYYDIGYYGGWKTEEEYEDELWRWVSTYNRAEENAAPAAAEASKPKTTGLIKFARAAYERDRFAYLKRHFGPEEESFSEHPSVSWCVSGASGDYITVEFYDANDLSDKDEVPGLVAKISLSQNSGSIELRPRLSIPESHPLRKARPLICEKLKSLASTLGMSFEHNADLTPIPAAAEQEINISPDVIKMRARAAETRRITRDEDRADIEQRFGKNVRYNAPPSEPPSKLENLISDACQRAERSISTRFFPDKNRLLRKSSKIAATAILSIHPDEKEAYVYSLMAKIDRLRNIPSEYWTDLDRIIWNIYIELNNFARRRGFIITSAMGMAGFLLHIPVNSIFTPAPINIGQFRSPMAETLYKLGRYDLAFAAEAKHRGYAQGIKKVLGDMSNGEEIANLAAKAMDASDTDNAVGSVRDLTPMMVPPFRKSVAENIAGQLEADPLSFRTDYDPFGLGMEKKIFDTAVNRLADEYSEDLIGQYSPHDKDPRKVLGFLISEIGSNIRFSGPNPLDHKYHLTDNIFNTAKVHNGLQEDALSLMQRMGCSGQADFIERFGQDEWNWMQQWVSQPPSPQSEPTTDASGAKENAAQAVNSRQSAPASTATVDKGSNEILGTEPTMPATETIAHPGAPLAQPFSEIPQVMPEPSVAPTISTIPAEALVKENDVSSTIDLIDKIFKDVNIRSGAAVLLSENLFIENGDRTELEQGIKIALKPVLDSGAIAILSPEEIRAQIKRNPSKDKLAVVLSKEDNDGSEIWKSDEERNYAKASVLIVGDKLTGENYLYLQGVIGLARAIMSGNRQAIAYYYKILSGSDIGDDILKLLDNAEWNNIAFALKAILRFKGLCRMDPEELKASRIRMETLLIAA
ncbi:MAG: 4-alpha-glucanotransferase [Candidatus Omnitrophota bacterium]|jgi:4-alpha-glucanotransferase